MVKDQKSTKTASKKVATPTPFELEVVNNKVSAQIDKERNVLVIEVKLPKKDAKLKYTTSTAKKELGKRNISINTMPYSFIPDTSYKFSANIILKEDDDYLEDNTPLRP